MNIELEKFITDLDEHLKKKAAELNTDERAKQLCAILGCVKVKSKNKRVRKEKSLVDIIDVMGLEREIKAIVSGARTEMVYEYQEFASQFAEEEEMDGEDE